MLHELLQSDRVPEEVQAYGHQSEEPEDQDAVLLLTGQVLSANQEASDQSELLYEGCAVGVKVEGSDGRGQAL